MWSYLLTAVGVIGLWLAGRRRWQGWAIGLAAQTLWIWYAISTRQWGFLLSALAYGTVYGRNLWRWRRDLRRPKGHPVWSLPARTPPPWA